MSGHRENIVNIVGRYPKSIFLKIFLGEKKRKTNFELIADFFLLSDLLLKRSFPGVFTVRPSGKYTNPQIVDAAGQTVSGRRQLSADQCPSQRLVHAQDRLMADGSSLILLMSLPKCQISLKK